MMLRRAWIKIKAWFIGDDPSPEYSWLDNQDGLK